jgi:predicted ABC-type ATPase
MSAEAASFVITVLAGVNGAGKSSVGGAMLEQSGGVFYNPDAVARAARAILPALTVEEANALAWLQGRQLLESAIRNRTDFNFETTLGGKTITRLLIKAAKEGATLNIWYVGLGSVELHLQRVAARVKMGGHSIPEDDVRKRWISSQVNLVNLLPHVSNVRIYDNTTEKDPHRGEAPEPQLVLSVTDGVIEFPGTKEVKRTPQWAKSIVVAAFRTLPHA